jgi:hypothetical protein
VSGSLMDQIKETSGSEIEEFLQRVGHTAQSAKKEFLDFYAKVEPDIEAQLALAAEGRQLSKENLNFLRDRLFVKAGEIAIGSHQHIRQGVVSIIIAVLRAGIVLA